jgi:hypothetical protein
MQRDEALRLVVVGLQRREPAQFVVGLVGYLIEGRPYSADALSVDAEATPNLQLTDQGFVCDAFFPAAILDPETVAARGYIQRSVGGQEVSLIRVHIEVKAEDIWSITECSPGEEPRQLFLSSDQLMARKLAFERMQRAWYAHDDPSIH